jgi:hypothetical protein
VEDNIWSHYAHLESYLEGRGVPNVNEAMKEIFLKPLHQSFRALVNKEMFEVLFEQRLRKMTDKVDSILLKETGQKMQAFLQEVHNFGGDKGSAETAILHFTEMFPAFFQLGLLDKIYKCPEIRQAQSAIKSISTYYKDQKIRWYTLLSWMMVHHIGAMVDPDDIAAQSRATMDEWLLVKIMEQNLYHLGIQHEQVQRSMLAIKILTSHQRWWLDDKEKKQKPVDILETLLSDGEVRDFLQVNRYREVLWFNKEAFDELLKWMLSSAVMDTIVQAGKNKKALCKELEARYKIIRKLQTAQKKSEYQVEKLLAALK